MNFPNQPEAMVRFGGRGGGQQQQAVGLLTEVGADRVETALKDRLAERFFQVRLDTASETRVVGDQCDTITALLVVSLPCEARRVTLADQ
jgi:hypothetical protein